MPMLQKFGKIIDDKILQNEEGQHSTYLQIQIQKGGIPVAGDDIIYDCSLDG